MNSVRELKYCLPKRTPELFQGLAHLVFQHMFLSKNRIDFFCDGISREHHRPTGKLPWKKFQFDRCINIWLVPEPELS